MNVSLNIIFRRIFFLLIFIISYPLCAEKLEVKILQKGSGDPVYEATVVIKQSGEYDKTDQKGQLRFEDVTLPIDLKVLATGYETFEQQISEPKITLFIEPLLVEANSLTVVEDRIQEKTSKITLQKEELHSVAGTQGDPIKMVESLPGVVKNTNGEIFSNYNTLFIRGSSGAENSYVMQGLPVDNLYHIWGISIVNPSLVDNFNIFLGGFPVDYKDVLGGVIDMRLRKPKTDRLRQTYRIAFNESSALIEGPINNKQSFFAAARASYVDKLLQPFIDDIQEASKEEGDTEDIDIVMLPRYWDAQANWHYDTSRGNFDLFYFGSNDRLIVDINNVDDLDPDIIGRANYNVGFHTTGVNLSQRLSSNTTGIITSSLKQGHLQLTLGNDASGQPFGYNVDTKELFFHPQLVWRPQAKSKFLTNMYHEFTFGNNTEYRRYDGQLNTDLLDTEEDSDGGNFSSRRKFKTDVKMRIIESGSYIKWRWSWNKLTTTTGLRYSRLHGTNGISMSAVSPRLQLEYQSTKKLLLTGAWGKYIQAPNPAVLIQDFGNPNLGYTHAEHRIAGLQYQLNDLWSVQTEVYHKPMKKLVLTRHLEDPPDNYRNDGDGEAYGIDVLIKRNYGNRKMGWLSYSYAKSKRKSIGGEERDFSGDQPHSFSLVWSQPFTGSWLKWSWGLKLQASSGQTYTPVVGRVAMCNTSDGSVDICPNQFNASANEDIAYWRPIYAKKNMLRWPFSHKLDLRIDRVIRFNTWTMKIYLDIINVTMQPVGVREGYGKNYRNYRNPAQLTSFPSIPLPFLGIEATF